VFVTNFPDSFGSRDLWNLCEAYGKVVDVFIPNRKSKAGKRFAFVRFIRVEDMDRLMTHNIPGSYVAAVKDTYSSPVNSAPGPSSPALVLDDTYVQVDDLSRCAMGRVKESNSIPNLYTILTKEGFADIHLSYLGGLWVTIDFKNEKSKRKLLQHKGVHSWFHALQDATHDFVSNERVVRVDIEGIPLNLWSPATFSKISKKWGEIVDIEESPSSTFARKRICVKTSRVDNILETFKDVGYISEDESILGDKNNTDNPQQGNGAMVGESEDEGENNNTGSVQQKETSNDFPLAMESSSKGNSKVKPNSQDFHANESSSESSTRIHSRATLNGGSILEVLDDMIKVGQSMGDDMEGLGHKTKNEWVKELNYKHGINFLALQETKMDCISHMDVKFIWGLINRWKGETMVLGDFNEVKMEGYSFTWSHPSATKMSKLNRFLVSEGIILTFPAITAVYLDCHLSDHRPIILNEIHTDFAPTPFRIFYSWFKRDGFDAMVEQTDTNLSHVGTKNAILKDLGGIDKNLDNGVASDEMLVKRMELMHKLHELKQLDLKDAAQKAKVKWAIEGDENSKNFHGIINKRRSQLAIRGVFVSGDWHTEPSLVKDTFLDHFAARFKQPSCSHLKLSMTFPNRLSSDQIGDLDKNITMDEIRAVVWDCRENKSPGPDGYTFEFFRRYWNLIGSDFSSAVKCFFKNGSFPRGCNSSFITLIPKVVDAKFVTDFRPISLIGGVYKVVTKILANRLAMVISDLVSNTQSAFIANRQILNGPFILNKVLTWCERKRMQALVFKVSFAKAYDSVRWDFLLDVLQAFGFGPRWCTWICGIFSSNMASILVNGSPTGEFPICCGLKQGDHLAPLLFILVMESFHISVSRAVNDGVFKGLQIQGSVSLSYLFYADDVVFIGEWSDDNLDNLIRILKCFHLASGSRINVNKSQVLGVGIPTDIVQQGASRIGCDIMQMPFKYLGVMVGDHMSRYTAWSNSIQKVRARLSKWKVKTLFVSGRLTLLKSVLGAVPIYNMSIYKAPISVLHEMEMFRNKFFNEGDSQVLDSKGFDFLSHCKIRVGDGLNTRFWPVRDGAESHQWTELMSMLGTISLSSSPDRWVCDLNGDGVFRVKDIRSTLDDIFLPSSGVATRWVKYVPIKVNIFAWRARLDRFPTRGATWLSVFLKNFAAGGTFLGLISRHLNIGIAGSPLFVCRLSSKLYIRSTLDDLFLPSSGVATRWVKYVPIKVNIFAWRARLDRLLTRGATWLSVFLKNFTAGGTFLGLISRRLKIGIAGSPLFICRLSSKLC
nr:RNA-directed DNA polymerase, eukaryota [Tanacetum cinerariifolium]